MQSLPANVYKELWLTDTAHYMNGGLFILDDTE